MDIRLVDLQAQYARLKPSIDDRIAAVLAHGQFIMGPEVAMLEEQLARGAACRHAVGVASGTDALLIPLMAAGVGPGDAVFVPSFTFTATAEVVLMVGATPVFVDVDARTYNIDVAQLEREIDRTVAADALRPRAIVAVDLFGLPADYDSLRSIAERHALLLIADAAQSYGAVTPTGPVGSLAPITATSFFPAKPLGAYGDGGAIFTHDDALADVMRSIRQHGKGREKYDIARTGVNSRLDTLQAAILLAKLEAFDDEIAARNRIAGKYNERLRNLVVTPAPPDGTASAWAQYTIQVDSRDAVAAKLKSAGVPCAVYYPRPMHLQPAYRKFGSGPGSLPVSERLCDHVLSLPIHPDLTDAAVERVCETLAATIRAC